MLLVNRTVNARSIKPGSYRDSLVGATNPKIPLLEFMRSNGMILLTKCSDSAPCSANILYMPSYNCDATQKKGVNVMYLVQLSIVSGKYPLVVLLLKRRHLHS